MKSNYFKPTVFFLLGALFSFLIMLFFFGGLFKYRALDKTLNSISKNTYSQEYNCVNFSTDAVQKLNEVDIPSSIIVVKSQDSQSSHAIISVWFDPQLGTFAKRSQYLGDYEELKLKYGWTDRSS